MVRSPIKWSGGKSKLRKKIIELLPEHKCYVEPFGGAGWVLFGKEPSDVEILNDIDNELINFFIVLKHKPEELVESFNFDLVSRKVFMDFRELTSEELQAMSDIERAHRFYYLIMSAWGGEFGKPRFQTSVSDPGGHGNRLINAIIDIEKRIQPAYERLRTVIIENLDWEECIHRYDRKYSEKKVIMYIDPPYPGNNVGYNHNMKELYEHRRLISVLEGLQSYFLLTSYDLPEVRELFNPDKFNIMSVDFASGMPIKNNKTHRNKEIIVTNYDPIIREEK